MSMIIKQWFHNYVYEQRWTLGFIESTLEDIVNGNPYEIRYVKGMPKDRWFADPFILDYDEQTIQVLVEEYCYKERRGRIARLTIDRYNYHLLSYIIILDLPTHVSFPFIERKEGKIFVSPENSESGSWKKYQYDMVTNHLKIVNEEITSPLTDAIRTSLLGEELIFSTSIPSQNGNVLTIYSAEGNKNADIIFSSRIARNAGDWFKVGNKVYRPAQDCNGGYGKAVILQEVIKENDGKFVFKDVCRITSTNPMYTTGCHTFNSFKDLTIVDVHGFRRPNFVKLITILKKF